MTDSDSLRGDIDRHTHLPQCCGELETLRALLRPRMADAGDPTPTEALRGMFIEIERLRARDGRRRPMDNENAITRLTSELAAERKLARAAGEGHDRARALLEAIASVFGRVDGFDALPAMVTKLEEQRAALVRAGEYDRGEVVVERQRLAEANQRIDEMKQALAIGAEKRAALEDRLSREIAKTREMGAKQVHEAVEWCTVNAGRGLAAELAQDAAHRLQAQLTSMKEPAIRWAISQALHIGAETAISWADSHWGARLNEAQRMPFSIIPASLEAIRESPCPKLDEVCHVRAGRPRFFTIDQKLEVWLIEPTALPGYMISGRDDHWQWNNDAHSTCVAGYKSAAEAIAGARENSKATQSRVGLERWTKICEAFGFDPEQDPPVSIPAILAGDRWTNTRRMLADACANMRAPSLEVILGELIQTLSKAPCMLLDLAKARSQALNVLGWSGADDPVEWAKEARRLADERIDVLQAELGVHAATIAEAEIQTEKLVAALNEKTAALDVADAHFSSLKRGHDEAHAALATLGWDGNSYPEDWAKTTAAHYKAVREALGVPAGKPIVAYAQHAAKGMQALAILGWQDGNPIEWATKRAAAEADLRGALAEAELVGNDHAAMVRQLWNNLRGTAAKLDDTARLCNEATSSHARAEKRLSTWRAWAAGFCPMGFDASASDDSIIAALAFVPVSAYNREISALQVELAHQRALVSVMVDIKRRLIALKDLSP